MSEYSVQEKFYYGTIALIYFLYLLAVFGFFNSTSKYLIAINSIFRLYVCLFLIIRFNPLRQHYSFSALDRKISFNAGVFLLTTTVLNSYVVYFRDTLFDTKNVFFPKKM